jgi:pimeloyl-ACP methyl ester carboxylesterase
MDKYIRSSDGVNIHYEITSAKSTAIVFVHGWLGNANWWDEQRSDFEDRYTVALVDLPGHGKSDKSRINWSSTQYAQDIKAVVDNLESENTVLVGHSMSGAYALQASLYTPRVKAVIIVDTLKDMDRLMNYEQANELLFTQYRQDFKWAVENILPQLLFAPSTPEVVRQQIQAEFLKNDHGFAVRPIEPLYKMDVREVAKLVKVPVRAINSDLTPTNSENNRKYFEDYEFSSITKTGHYPMLERPKEFNRVLNEVLQTLSIEN